MLKQLDTSLAVRQIQGDRNYQEDDFDSFSETVSRLSGSEENILLLLADGMGGHAGGAKASKTCIETFSRSFRRSRGLLSERLLDSLLDANQAIADVISVDPGLDGMGTTLVAASITSKGLEWISVGDSPMWLFRDGALQRLNADHSMAPVLAHMVESGRMSADDAATDRMRNSLRSVVNGSDISIIDQSSRTLGLEADDLILMSSDGLETIPDGRIANILGAAKPHDVETTASRLIKEVEAIGKRNQDNTTLMLFHCEQARHERAISGRGIAARPKSVKKLYNDFSHYIIWSAIVVVALGVVALTIFLFNVFLSDPKSDGDNPEIPADTNSDAAGDNVLGLDALPADRVDEDIPAKSDGDLNLEDRDQNDTGGEPLDDLIEPQNLAPETDEAPSLEGDTEPSVSDIDIEPNVQPDDFETEDRDESQDPE